MRLLRCNSRFCPPFPILPAIPDCYSAIPDFYLVIPDCYYAIPDFYPVIPAKAGIQRVGDAVRAPPFPDSPTFAPSRLRVRFYPRRPKPIAAAPPPPVKPEPKLREELRTELPQLERTPVELLRNEPLVFCEFR